jgi:hypothetical protein
MPHLVVSVEGVEIKHVPLRKQRTTLGRLPDNDIVFDNMIVSGHHCAFELEGVATVYVEDLHSTNGTYIDRKMVKRQQLRDGDVIAIGNFRLQFVAAAAAEKAFGHSTTAFQAMPEAIPRHASLKVVNGSSAGLEVPVVKAVTTFGKPGVSVVSVSHRRDGYYVAYLEGESQPTLNGGPIGMEGQLLANDDVLDLAGTRMLFRLQPQGR